MSTLTLALLFATRTGCCAAAIWAWRLLSSAANSQEALNESHEKSNPLAAVVNLVDANEQLQLQLDCTELKLQAQARQIESQAIEARTDVLTLIANRRAFDDELRRCLEEFTEHGQPASLLLLDVDHFKRFNDSHGHPAGDDALRMVAKILRQNIPAGNLVARYGGEEFAAIFAHSTLPRAQPAAERARLAVAGALVRVAGQERRVTASGGIAELLPGDDAHELLRRADEALYGAKQSGRNCLFTHDGCSVQCFRGSGVGDNRHHHPDGGAGDGGDDFGQVDDWLTVSADASDRNGEDPVAKMPGREVFLEGVERHLDLLRQKRIAPLSLILLQVDHFDRFATGMEESAADVALRVAAQIVKATMRDIDLVSRLDDDILTMLLPGVKRADAARAAERMRRQGQKCKLPKTAKRDGFTFSLGVVEATAKDDVRLVLLRAQEALQLAVARGRNRVHTI